MLDGDHDNGAVAEALDLLRHSPALTEARRTAQAEVDAARAALEGVPSGPVRVALQAVADQSWTARCRRDQPSIRNGTLIPRGPAPGVGPARVDAGLQIKELDYPPRPGTMRHMVCPKRESLITQMRRGTLEYCVLALLRDRPRYGFDLVATLAQADGLVTSKGTVYPLLSRLRRDGLVTTSWHESPSGPPRRYYQLTPAGQAALGCSPPNGTASPPPSTASAHQGGAP